MLNRTIARKLGLTAKQAKMLASIREQDQFSTEQIGRQEALEYADARNQIRALMKVGFLDVYGQEGRTRLYGITPEGLRAVSEMQKGIAAFKPENSATNATSAAERVKTPDVHGDEITALAALIEKLSEIRTLFITRPGLAALVMHMLTGPRVQG